jgi:mRNA interferase RelE/StbE
MGWRIEFEQKAMHDLERLEARDARRILRFLQDRIALRDDPRSIGEALQGARFTGMWKYRVGHYRILCEIQDEKVTVLVVRIGHRREIYR